MLLQIDGLVHTEASTVAFLTQGYVVWIPLILAVMTRKIPPLVTLLCCAAVLAGVAVLSGFNLRTFHVGRGELSTLACSFLFAGQILWAERPGYANNRMALVTVLSFLIAAMAFIPVSLATLPSPMILVTLYADPWRLGTIVLLGVICTGLGMLLMFCWQRFVGATAAALIYSTEPIWASLFAFVLPGLIAGPLGVAYANEAFTRALLVGGGLILAANLIMQICRRPAPSAG
jgi:drug/metabolite transporter (DMT)-like permease